MRTSLKGSSPSSRFRGWTCAAFCLTGCATAISLEPIAQLCAGDKPNRYPAVVKFSAALDNAPGMTLRDDGRGAYADDSLRCVGVQQQTTGLTQVAFPVSSTYGCRTTSPPRTWSIDFTRPVPSSKAISLGVVRPIATNIIVIPSVDRRGYVGLTDLPIGKTSKVQVFAIVNRDNGDRLAFAPHGIKGCGPFLPGPFPETTEARVTRLSRITWDVALPAGSIGELYRVDQDLVPVTKGRYYFEAHVVITALDSTAVSW